jgi:hypothetical protein
METFINIRSGGWPVTVACAAGHEGRSLRGEFNPSPSMAYLKSDIQIGLGGLEVRRE